MSYNRATHGEGWDTLCFAINYPRVRTLTKKSRWSLDTWPREALESRGFWRATDLLKTEEPEAQTETISGSHIGKRYRVPRKDINEHGVMNCSIWHEDCAANLPLCCRCER